MTSETAATPRRYSAAIFDLDGVLVDTARLHYQAWRRLAKELGFDFSERDNEALKGVSRMCSLEILLAHGGIAVDKGKKQALADRKNDVYRQLLQGLTEGDLLPGARECLEALRRRGIKIALASASKNAPFVLERLGIARLFDAVVDGTVVSASKPDPEIFLRSARELGARPAECVVIEDASAGVEAAKKAGMVAVGIGSPELLSEADRVVPGVKDFDFEAFFCGPPQSTGLVGRRG